MSDIPYTVVGMRTMSEQLKLTRLRTEVRQVDLRAHTTSISEMVIPTKQCGLLNCSRQLTTTIGGITPTGVFDYVTNTIVATSSTSAAGILIIGS